MSLLGELAGAVRGVARGALAGVTGGASEALYSAYKATKPSKSGPRMPPPKIYHSAAPAGGMSMFPALPAIGGAIAGATRLLPSILPRVGSLIPAAGTAARVAVSGARQVWGKLPRWSKEAAAAAGLTIAGSMVLDSAGNPVGRIGGRRMNPMNAKAARRAIRRIKSVRKILTNIEKSLPRARRR